MKDLFGNEVSVQSLGLPCGGLIKDKHSIYTNPQTGEKVRTYARILVRRVKWILNLWPADSDNLRYEVLRNDAVLRGGELRPADIPKLFEEYMFLWIVRFYGDTLPEILLDILNTIEKPYPIIFECYENKTDEHRTYSSR